MNYKHGMFGTPTHNTWRQMMRRCHGYSSQAKWYRDKGIVVCDKWHDFNCFLEDMGHRPEGKTLDRIDSEKPYEPGNCRWATVVEQARNKSNNRVFQFEGRKVCLIELSELLGVCPETIRSRIKKGWPESEVLRPSTSRHHVTGRKKGTT